MYYIEDVYYLEDVLSGMDCILKKNYGNRINKNFTGIDIFESRENLLAILILLVVRSSFCRPLDKRLEKRLIKCYNWVVFCTERKDGISEGKMKKG